PLNFFQFNPQFVLPSKYSIYYFIEIIKLAKSVWSSNVVQFSSQRLPMFPAVSKQVRVKSLIFIKITDYLVRISLLFCGNYCKNISINHNFNIFFIKALFSYIAIIIYVWLTFRNNSI